MKRMKATLTKQSGLPAVLSSQSYTDYAAYSTVNTVTNILPDFNYIASPYKKSIFDMVQPITCIDFPLCSDEEGVSVYSLRENRVLNPVNANACSLVQPARPLTQKAKDISQCKTGCVPIVRWPGDNRRKPNGSLHR